MCDCCVDSAIIKNPSNRSCTCLVSWQSDRAFRSPARVAYRGWPKKKWSIEVKSRTLTGFRSAQTLTGSLFRTKHVPAPSVLTGKLTYYSIFFCKESQRFGSYNKELNLK